MSGSVTTKNTSSEKETIGTKDGDRNTISDHRAGAAAGSRNQHSTKPANTVGNPAPDSKQSESKHNNNHQPKGESVSHVASGERVPPKREPHESRVNILDPRKDQFNLTKAPSMSDPKLDLWPRRKKKPVFELIQEDTDKWNVFATVSQRGLIGNISLRDSQLTFRWQDGIPTKNLEVQRSFSNCIIELTSEQRTERIFLRKPVAPTLFN